MINSKVIPEMESLPESKRHKSSSLTQFRLLCWKNFLIVMSNKGKLLFELIVPFSLALIFIITRSAAKPIEVNQPTVWPSFPAKEFTNKTNVTYLQIYSTPKNDLTQRILKGVKDFLTVEKDILWYNEESDMEKDIKKLKGQDYKNTIGIIFQKVSDNTLPDETIYSIRLPTDPDKKFGQEDWHTRGVLRGFSTLAPNAKDNYYGGSPNYPESGFLAFQIAIDRSILKERLPSIDESYFDVLMKRLPHPPHTDDPILNSMPFLAFIIFISYNINTLNFIREVVLEKEKKLRELMKIAGLKNSLNWGAWVLKAVIVIVIISAIFTLFLTVKTNNGAFLNKSDPSVILIFFILYGLSYLSYCCIIASLFYKSKEASGIGSLLSFFMYMPNFFLANQWSTISPGVKWGTGLLYNMAMVHGWTLLQSHEMAGYGAKWSNINTLVTADQNFKISYVFVLLVIDIVVYLLIAWYVDNVFPGEFGIPRPFYFPFTKSYWLGIHEENTDLSDKLTNLQSGEFFEEPSNSLRPGLRIRQLVKSFKVNKRKIRAVDELDMDVYEGQITALLGHNGAGKSTTMAMLTGLLKPSSGKALINGIDITQDQEGARQQLGYCPQENVLFDQLTVEQQLKFFAELKGCPKENLKAEIDNTINILGLDEKRKDLSGKLSGGQKRRLCIGIALINGSNTLILDEPTAGLDPEARRKMWDILQKIRAGRTILLATHFMDEADLLGDSIGIMANGKLQCFGSSLFLKSKFGVGYHMVMAKASNCSVDKITEKITEFVPDAKLESNVSSELSFILPKESSKNYEEMFRTMEDNLESYGINSFGVSITTLEEVFLKVGEMTHADGIDRLKKDTDKENANNDLSRINVADSSPLFKTEKKDGLNFSLLQIQSQFSKKWSVTRNNKVLAFFQLIFPAILVLLAVLNNENIIKATSADISPRDLVLSMVEKNNVILKSSSNKFRESYEKYVRNFKGTSFAFTSNPNLTAELIDIGKQEVTTYLNRYLIACEVSGNTKIAYFNAQYYHTSAVTLSAYTNALMKELVNSDYSIKTVNHPLPYLPDSQAKRDQRSVNIGSSSTVSNFIIAASVIFGTICVYTIKERVSKSKHLQFVSGIKIFNYWIPHYIYDSVNILLGLTIVTFVATVAQLRGFTDDLNYFKAFTLAIGLALAGVPITYLLCNLFTIPSTGNTFILMIYLFSGVATIISVLVLRILDTSISRNIAESLDWIFTILWPFFNYGIGIANILQKHANVKLCSSLTESNINTLCSQNREFTCCKPENRNKDYFSFENFGIGKHLFFLFLQAIFFFGIVILKESNLFTQLRKKMHKKMVHDYQYDDIHSSKLIQRDEDVEKEREKILSFENVDTASDYVLIAQSLSKYYGNLIAVNDISLGVKKGTCFGLLGVNGAGKTTTFKMLTGDEPMSKGNAFIDGHNVSTDLDKTHKLIGYCPQFDAIIDELTVTEMIQMYCKIRGIQNIDALCNELLDLLILREHANKLTSQLSGGNKRKLSTALAFIGNPPIVFLDEPTSGMDPLAKRIVWDVITKMRENGTSLVLTSHSMEECEALCTEMVIMVNGEFKCFGGVQHLKSKFGKGYSLLARVKTPKDGEYELGDATNELKKFVEENFEGAVLKDSHDGYIHYQIASEGSRWSTLFSIMEKAKEKYRIEDYSVSQTTLEEVFIGFAKLQTEREHRDVSFSVKCSNCMQFVFCCGCCR